MPQMSAALTALGLAGGRVMVICTGDGLQMIRLGNDYTPVEVAEVDETCALLHAADTAATAGPKAGIPQLLYAPGAVVLSSLQYGAKPFYPAFARGPPRG